MTDPATYINGRTVQEQMNNLIGYVDQRSAEVALDAIATDVAQVHSDAADAHADALAAAASAAAAAGTLANAVKKTGEASQSIAGDIAVAGALSGGSISTSGAATFSGTITVPTPTNNTDAATKKYVDDADALKISITDINSYAVGLTGNQGAIAGVKQFAKPPALAFHESGSGNVDGWRKIFVSPTFAVNNEYNICSFELITSKGSYGLFTAIGRNGSLYNVVKRVGNFTIANVKMSIDSAGEVIIWAYDYRTVGKMNLEVHAGSNSVTFADSGTTSTFAEPTTPDYVQVLTCTE